MQPFLTFFSSAQNLASIGVMIGGIGYAYEKFIGGRSVKKQEASQQTKDNTVLIDNLEARINSMTDELKRQQNEHARDREQWTKERGELLQKLGQLEGQMKEKDGKLAEYKEIFQNRDPELKHILERLVPILERIEPLIPSEPQAA